MRPYRALRVALLAVAVAPSVSAGQSLATRLISDARAQIDALNPDSAFALLQLALEPKAAGTEAERVRAFTLLGIVELVRGNRQGGRQSFEQALRLDGSLRIDSLADLQSDARVVFAEARTLVAPVVAAPPALAITADVPADTTVSADSGRVRFEAHPTRTARVVVAITPADNPAAIVWSDTQVTSVAARSGWPVRGRDGRIIPSGRYVLRVTAADSLGQVSPTIERILIVSRVPADTQPLPPRLLPSAFAPETLRLRHGSPPGLLFGLTLAAGIAVIPTLAGNAAINSGHPSDRAAYAVAGGVSLTSVAVFLAGHRERASPENRRRNQQLRERDAATRLAIVRANADAREQAPVRVRREGASHEP